MEDFEFGKRIRPEQQADAFQPGASVSPDGVNLFATDLYSQELQSGMLVDVSDMAREVGFMIPVAVTRSLWEDINAIPETHAHEDVQGRLWDVLYMAGIAVRRSGQNETELQYRLVLHVGKKSAYSVRLVRGPGDDGLPALTLSSIEKDIDLPLGRIVLTEGAMDAFLSAQAAPSSFLLRHRRGDWGELDAEDIAANNRAARADERVLSAYTLPNIAKRIWIITEWDRSVTTLLLPSEY